jgi:hypothetical protein
VHDNVDETARARLDGLERVIDAGERIGLVTIFPKSSAPTPTISAICWASPVAASSLAINRLHHAAGTLPIETGAAYNVVRRPTVFHAVNPERSARNERAVMRTDAHTTTRKP